MVHKQKKKTKEESLYEELDRLTEKKNDLLGEIEGIEDEIADIENELSD